MSPKFSVALKAWCWLPIMLGLLEPIQAEEVSRSVPVFYTENIEPMLTPLAKVLETKDTYKAADAEGATLLSERIDFVDEKGRSFAVEHNIYRALAESSCESVAKDTYSFRRSQEKIHLVQARTILPDGREIPVQPNAAFIKSPQQRASSALYDDEGELIVIFPNVGVGSITETIVVIEENEARIPGEFTRMFSWRSGWPKVQITRTVDLPDALATKLKITSAGQNVPQPTKSHPAPGRTRFVWSAENQKSPRYEEGMPPTAQTGPATWLTTLSGWADFAHWYGKLLEGRSTLNPALAKQVDEWTKNAKSNQEILEILTERVARDVRYVGLEFGIAGYQPADCNDVWANRYGDCKDKANLLRAMLLHKKVPAQLVLLNTEHAGQLEKRSPDHRLFDHMILMAEPEPGKRIFCDPTIEYAKAGVIAPSDADRDVFLIDGEKYEWARTPPADGGDLIYRFDLKKDEQGDVSGWMAFRATGFYAAAYAADYAGRDREDTLKSVGDRLRDFFPSAEVVDVEKMPSQVEDGGFSFKTFFILPAGSQSQTAIKMPVHSGLLPSPGDDAKRLTPFFMWRDTVEVQMQLSLPPSLEATSVPKPYRVNSSAMEATASWTPEKDGIKSVFKIRIKKSLLDVDEYPVLRNAARSLLAWLDQPLLLGERQPDGSAETPAPAQTPQEITLENFPMMPTPEGQRDLLDKRFGPESNLTLRKKALQTIIQYFPNDKTTVFYARMFLAILQYDAGEKEKGIEQIKRLIEDYRTSIEPGWIEWGEYRLAYTYLEEDKNDLALPLFQKVASDQNGSDFRRGWSSYHAANILTKSSPDEAISLLQKGIELNTEALSWQLPLLVKLLIDKGETEQAADIARKIAARENDYSAPALLALIKSEQGWTHSQLEKLIGVLEQSGVAADGEPARELARLRGRMTWGASGERLQAKLKEYLEKNPRKNPAKSDKKTVQGIKEEIQKAEDDRVPDRAIDLTLQILTEFPADGDFLDQLWRAGSRCDWYERVNGDGTAGPLLPFLFDLCEELPKDNDSYFEASVIRALRLNRQEHYAETETLLRQLLAEPTFDEGYESSVRRDFGLALEKQGKYEEALENYLQLKSEIGDHSRVSDLMLRAVFIELHLGHEDKALELLGLLQKVSPNVAKKATYAAQITSMTRLAAQPEAARAYWKDARAWRSEWETLFGRLGGDRAEKAFEAVPIIDSLSEMGTETGNAIRSRDKKAVAQNTRLAVSAARWDPEMATEVGSLWYSLDPFYSDISKDLTSFVVAILTPVFDEGSELDRSRAVTLGDAYGMLKEPSKTMEAIRPYLKEEKRDEINAAFRRVWAIAAFSLKDEQPAAIAAMEELLALPDATVNRGLTVKLAAQLYVHAGLHAERLALLKRELENPRVKSSAQYEELQGLLSVVRDDDAAKADFNEFLEGWLKKYKPAWYDYAKPASLTDPMLKNLDALIENPQATLQPAEVIKLRLLLAQDKSRDYIARLNAWDQAALAMMDYVFFKKENEAYLKDIIENPKLSEDIRQRWRIFSLIFASGMYDEKAFAEYRKALDIERCTVDQRDSVEVLEIMAAVDVSKAESVTHAFTKISSQPITNLRITQLDALYSAILRLGELEAAQKMYDGIAQWTFVEGFSQTVPAISLRYLKELKLARRWTPLQQRLRDVALKYFPEKEIQRPANYDDIKYPLVGDLLEVETSAIRLYRIAQRQITPADLSFWLVFVRDLAQDKRYKLLRVDLARAMVDEPLSDDQKAIAIILAMSTIDSDDLHEWSQILKICQPYRNSDQWPASSKAIRDRELLQSLRTGDDAQVAVAATQFASRNAEVSQQRMAVPHYLSKKDVATVREIMERMSPEELLNVNCMRDSFKAMTAIGLEDETKLLQAAARREIYSPIIASWIMPTQLDLRKVLDISCVLTDSQLPPSAWWDDMMSRVKDDMEIMYLRTVRYSLEKKWDLVEKAAHEALQIYPAFHSFQWHRGLALYHLDRKPEALEALKMYVRYSRTEIDYPEAMRLIKEIESTETAQR